VLYALHTRTGAASLLAAAVQAYRSARAEWARLARITTGVYARDVTYGPEWYQRGHWADRLPTIDRDIAAVARGGAAAGARPIPAARAGELVRAVLDPPPRPPADALHTPVRAFVRGRPLELVLALPARAGSAPAVTLHYRHVSQAEAWQASAMPREGSNFLAAIPGTYTDSPYPLQYYFEVAEASGVAWLYPGLGPDLTQQPYFAVRAP
jgi:hypothetical protein